jgi:hypothetical protein
MNCCICGVNHTKYMLTVCLYRVEEANPSLIPTVTLTFCGNKCLKKGQKIANNTFIALMKVIE